MGERGHGQRRDKQQIVRKPEALEKCTQHTVQRHVEANLTKTGSGLIKMKIYFFYNNEAVIKQFRYFALQHFIFQKNIFINIKQISLKNYCNMSGHLICNSHYSKLTLIIHLYKILKIKIYIFMPETKLLPYLI